jgi:hypothetical protein
MPIQDYAFKVPIHNCGWGFFILGNLFKVYMPQVL